MEELKQKVHDYWNSRCCGTGLTEKPKYSKEYFDEIEAYRYSVEPMIFSFAQFTRFHGKKVIEVGVGAGTDFVQWVRAGAKAYGIDLTSESVEHVKNRLNVYGLKAQDVQVADCEHIPFPDNTFDLVYSWGVIHHTPDTKKALGEIVRICKPGGICKIMVYNRHSIAAYYYWVRRALLCGRPWKSISWVIWNYVESEGTKAYTKNEVQTMLSGLPVENLKIAALLTSYETLKNENVIFTLAAFILSTLLGGNRVGWFLTIQFNKLDSATLV